MESEILRVLNQRAVKKAIQTLLAELETEIPGDFDPVKRNAARRDLISGRLPAVIQNEVIPKLSLPYVSTVTDIVEAGIANFPFATEIGLDIAYERFSIHAAADTVNRIWLESSFELMITEFDSYEGPDVIWEAGNFQLIWSWKYEDTRDISRHTLIVAILYGNCTKRAMDAVAREIGAVVQTTNASFNEIWKELKRVPVVTTPRAEVPDLPSDSENQPRSLKELSELFGARHEHDMREYRESSGYPERAYMNLLTSTLRAYFLSPSKKDSLDFRLRNAIRLLVESDRQQDVGLRLATSFSAIEALVCDKGDIAEMMSLHVATLLRCNADDRLEFKKRIKKLYDLRSKYLHGSYAEVMPQDQVQVRTVAACVMYAIIEWQDCSKRCGESGEDSEKFFSQLDDAKTAGKRMPGVPEFV